MRNKILLLPYLKIIIGSIIFYGLHFLIVENINSSYIPYHPLLQVHLLFFLMTIITCLLVDFMRIKFPDKAGFTFMGSGIIKMAILLALIFPFSESSVENKIPEVLSLFVVYFCYLILEVVFCMKILEK